MIRLLRKTPSRLGLEPGTLLPTEKEDLDPAHIIVYETNGSLFNENTYTRLEDCGAITDPLSLSWIRVTGIHDVDLLQKIGEQFNIHDLTLEDINSTNQRAKLDVFDAYWFLVLKSLRLKEKNDHLRIDQISFIIGDHYVISFEERTSKLFDPIARRLKNNSSRFYKLGVDFLTYSLIDIVVDHYFKVLEEVGADIDELEDEINDYPTPKTLNRINNRRRQMVAIKKAVWPVRDVMLQLLRNGELGITANVQQYLNDVQDHLIQVLEFTESYREILTGQSELYLSIVSQRTNETMKFLTVVATIFIPLTFIAGVYGMNFHYMPELSEPWGYPAVWAFMLSVATVMVIYFKRKQYL